MHTIATFCKALRREGALLLAAAGNYAEAEMVSDYFGIAAQFELVIWN
jgi:hypothetical protein